MVHVLIVEDDPTLRRWMQQNLPPDLNVATAASAAEAREQFGDAHVVLLDVDLPDEDGFKLCSELRSQASGRPLQVVLLAQAGNHDRVATSLEVGADDFIGLPVSDKELALRVKAAIIRFDDEARLFNEREYYRRAVKQEEELSSRVLDQNMDLKREVDELRRIARYDSLSGLLNRGSLFGLIETEIERAVRSGSALSGIMIDIDHFKQINDNHGHQAGDRVIERLGELLQRQLRKYDSAGRYGGEEFFVVLADADEEQALQFAGRFRDALQGVSIAHGDADIRFTVSMGIAEYRTGESRDNWIARADRAMYIAKRRGRDLIQVGSQTDETQ